MAERNQAVRAQFRATGTPVRLQRPRPNNTAEELHRDDRGGRARARLAAATAALVAKEPGAASAPEAEAAHPRPRHGEGRLNLRAIDDASAPELRVEPAFALQAVPILMKGTPGPIRIGRSPTGPVVALPREAARKIPPERLERIVAQAPDRVRLTSEADLRSAVAETIAALGPAAILAAIAATGPRPSSDDAERPDTEANRPLTRTEATAFAAWLHRPYATALAVQSPTTFAATVAEHPDRAREIAVEGRPMLAFAPTLEDLPQLTVAACRNEPHVGRLVVTDPAAIARADPAAVVIERPKTARWSFGIPVGLTAHQTLTLAQRWAALVLLAAACVVGALHPLALPIALQLFVTVVLLALSAARGAASLAEYVPRFAPPRRPLSDAALPRYSILVPLYNEAAAVPGLLASLARLDYPHAKLEAILLVEADDPATQAAIVAHRPPSWVRVIQAPADGPRTKPKALNIGLGRATGELVTVFDAEDRPEPAQLRIAAETFAAGPDQLACLQARLAIDHAGDTFITRMFAIEYACLFDVLLPWLAAKRFFFPLGGTSNHFNGTMYQAHQQNASVVNAIRV